MDEGKWWLGRAPVMAVVVLLLAVFLRPSEPSGDDVAGAELATEVCPTSYTTEDGGGGDHEGADGGYDEGYRDGYQDGYDAGYQDGQNEGDDCPTDTDPGGDIDCPDGTQESEPGAGDGLTAAQALGYSHPVFTDDFETFDENRWFVYGGPSEHRYGEFYPEGGGLRTGEQISVEDGVMTVTGLPDGTTAGMSTEESHQQQYGLWEVRAKIPAGALNYHSVLILMAGDTELDFMEVLEPEGRDVSGFLHLDGGDDNGQVTLEDNEWHNWAIEWRPERITLYLDGEKWHETVPGAQIPTDPGVLTIQLDWFPEDHGQETTATAELGIDWVNIYTQSGDPEQPEAQPDAQPASEPGEPEGTGAGGPDDQEGCDVPAEPIPAEPAPEPSEPDSDPEPDSGTEPPAASGAFFVDPDNNANAWAAANPDDPRQGPIVERIASQPGAKWFGDWTPDVSEAVAAYVDAAAAEDAVPILASYNIPNRDCGSYSSGGAAGEADYAAWITSFAEAIGDREAVVILEPDAVAQMVTCGMDDEAVAARVGSLRHATSEFAAKAPNAHVYLDAGTSGWVEPAAMAAALDQVGVQDIRGFAANVSNYKTTEDSTAYGNAINAALPAPQRFVVDTSRNGAPVDDTKWCNVRGATLGETSRWLVEGEDTAVDAHLWIKVPGDSDGECTHDRGEADPPAGMFSPDLGTALITGDWSGLPE